MSSRIRQLFTSDWHLNHKNVLTYCNRPWGDVAEMEKALFRNLDEMHEPGDRVCFLGDLSLSNRSGVLRSLSTMYEIGVRNLLFVVGNHDRRHRLVIQDHKVVQWCGNVRNGKLHFTNMFGSWEDLPLFMFHFPCRSWEQSTHGSRSVHGHSHGSMPPYFNSLDISVDNAYSLLGKYRPFTGQEVWENIQKINERIRQQNDDQGEDTVNPVSS